MRNLLSVPSHADKSSILDAADWVETSALFKDDRNISVKDLERALIQSNSISEDAARQIAEAAFKEIESRIAACSTNLPGIFNQYPFQLNGTKTLLTVVAELATNTQHAGVYLFMLLITRGDMGSGARKLDGVDPTKVFERLCAEVLCEFWGGKSPFCATHVFGTARPQGTGSSKFQANIEELCKLLREGVSYKSGARAPGGGDGKLDLVAWRGFNDGMPGSLIGFAQCKTGLHWRDHITKLQPKTFCDKFMTKPLLLSPVRVYMVPNRIGHDEWDEHTNDGGLLFDRCRITHYAANVNADILNDCLKWMTAAKEKERQTLKQRGAPL